MLSTTSRVELTRRVIAYYFLFALATVSWLIVGVLWVAVSVLENRAESTWLNRLGESTAAVRAAVVDQEQDFGPLVHRLQSKWGLAYCAVVSSEGKFLAHTSPEMVGQSQVVPTGDFAQWGDARRTRYLGQKSEVFREYETDVRHHGTTWGTVQLGVRDPGAWETVLSAAEYAPLAFLCPMAVMLFGAFTIHRTIRPLSDLADQLKHVAHVPTISKDDLHPVAAKEPIGAGWNRLVESFAAGGQQATLDDRLDQALEGYRQQKSQQILNSLPDGIAVTDETGLMTFANKSLLGLLGLGSSEETISGKTMEECLEIESAGTVAEPLLDPNSRGRSVVVEIGRSGDMSQGVLRVARLPQVASSGNSSGGHVWSVRDVTQQKLANQMRDQFVNAATHELRTPLSNIKAYAETLALSDSMDVEQQKMFCNTINDEVSRLARFVDDLLHLSRMEAGSTALNLQVTDMERLFADVIDKARPQMTQKQMTFETQLPAKLPELNVDKDKITVALVNLLGNAAKYTPEGGRVEMRVEATDAMLQIDVEDTGIGISVEELPKVLDKFFRSSDPRVSEQVGSGLGLSLTHEIIRLHGGKLSVHSELNKGSKFTATLPIAAK